MRLIIFRKSRLTYMAQQYEIREPHTFHCSFGAQVGMLEKRIYREYKIKLEELEILKDIFLIQIDKEWGIQRGMDYFADHISVPLKYVYEEVTSFY